MNMLRRHRLLETFLVETLGLDWSEIHVEAEELEHAISEKVLEKLDEFWAGHDLIHMEIPFLQRVESSNNYHPNPYLSSRRMMM